MGLSQRRLRQNPWIRDLVREHRVSHTQLIQPYFVVQGIKDRKPIAGLTGTFRETPETLLKQVEKDLEAGVRKILLFGVPGKRHVTVSNMISLQSKLLLFENDSGRICLFQWTYASAPTPKAVTVGS